MKTEIPEILLRCILSLVFAVGLLFTAVTPASAAGRCYVDSGANGDNDGTSWADAYESLQFALSDSACAEVWVAEGTYKPTDGTARTISFNLSSGLVVYGGFGGSESLVTQRNPKAHPTILSGDIGVVNNTKDNSYRVVNASGTDGTGILDGFTIEEGYANGASPYDRGAGMYNSGGSPKLANIIFNANSAVYGGAMFNGAGGSPSLNTITFDENSATYYGGGMYNSNSSPNLTNLIISANSAQYGGGIYNFNSSFTLTNVTFEANKASIHGGGMYDSSSSPSLTTVTFSKNTAVQFGGGMYNTNSSPILSKVVFSTNSAGYYGGGMYNGSASDPALARVTFTANTARDWGGGMLNSYSHPVLADVDFSANSAYSGGGMLNTFSNPALSRVIFNANTAHDGGGIYNAGSDPSLKNVTLYANTATYSGGGINNYSSNPILNNLTVSANSAGITGGGIHNDGSNPVISNTIVYGNTGGEVYDVSPSAPDISYSIVGGGCPSGAICTNVINADPQLSALSRTGGFTLTRALRPGSPAIDAGNNATCTPSDQRGIPRPKDGDGNGSAICDIGATETRFFNATFTSIASQDGWVVESAENSNLGSAINSSADTFILGDTRTDRQFRSILSFNTASLPPRAAVRNITLQINLQSVVGVDPFTTHGTLMVAIRKGSFSNNPALSSTDFEAAASRNNVGSISNIPLPGGWYQGILNYTARPQVNKDGLTQFRLRFALDDNDNSSADQLLFYSGNAADASFRPKLIVGYQIP